MTPSPPVGCRTPAWAALLLRVGRGLGSRRVRVQGATFRVISLDLRPGGSAWALRAFRDVRAVLDDVAWDGLIARSVVVECDTVAVGSTLTASGVTVTATLPVATIRTLLARSGSSWGVGVVGSEARLRWLPGLDVVVRADVVGGRLRFTPTALHAAGGWLRSPGWFPPVTVAVPALPGGLELVTVSVVDDAVVVRAVAAHWSTARVGAPRVVD